MHLALEIIWSLTRLHGPTLHLAVTPSWFEGDYRDVGTMHAPGWKPQPSLEGPYLSDVGSPAEAHETPHHQATSGGRWMMLWWRIGGPNEVLLLLLRAMPPPSIWEPLL